MSLMFSSSRFLLLLSLTLLSGCGSAPERTEPAVAVSATAATPLPVPKQPDLSGHWEKNYQLSDDFNSRLQLYVADIRRSYNTPQVNGNNRFQIGGFNASNRMDAINGLARFTEEITRMPLLEIEQDDTSVAIEREQDFTLRCAWQEQPFATSTNAFGADVCGWNQLRLLFQMSMGGGLGITHQFSLSADRNMLDVTTTVSSDAVAAPLTIRNIYQRYNPPEQDFNCTLTLTRNRVCNQRGATK